MTKGKLIVTEGGRDRVHELFESRTIIGRGANADLVLRSSTAGAQHCEITATEAGFRLIDLETLEGTEVNGKPVNQHLLSHGDTIKIGDAKITYLGQSASAGRRPRHPTQPVLTQLPTDEEGRPKRFYRHESRGSKNNGWITGVVVGGIVVLIAVVIVMLANSNPGEAERKAFGEAQALVAKEDLASFKRAHTILEKIPPGIISERRMQVLQQKIEIGIRELEMRAENDRAQKFFEGVQLRLESFPTEESKATFLRSRADAFRHEFPEHPLSEKLERMLDKLTGAELTGEDALEDDRWWQRKRNKIVDAIRLDDYLEAFQVLKEAEDHPERSAGLAKKLATQREILERKYERFFQRERDMALEAQTAGRTREARAILERLVKIPIEPYLAEAKRYLERLK